MNYYLADPDVPAAHIDPLFQYEQYGWEKGRNLSAAFSTAKSLAANHDMEAPGSGSLAHTSRMGGAEGRAIYSVEPVACLVADRAL